DQPVPDDSQILLEDYSPDGVLVAVVEVDEQVVYLHLAGHAHTDVAPLSCWVRNLRPAPMTLDEQPTGRAPLMPFDACAHPAGLPAPNADDLHVVWFPGGDGIALFDRNELLAVIPPWAGVDECTGYARDCTGQTPVAWFLGALVNNPVRAKVTQAMAFWDSWKDGDQWRPFQEAILAEWTRHLGAHSHYYKIDGNRWPPKFVARAGEHGSVFFTGGMAIRPQPRIDIVWNEPDAIRHVELALALDPSLAAAMTDEQATEIVRGLSRLVSFPWAHAGWLGPGHTVPTTGLPIGPSGQSFDALLVLADPPNAPDIVLPEYRGQKANLLWLVPISATERAAAMAAESQSMLDNLWSNGASWRHTDRTVSS
ncbi:MAG: hypothetical protein ACI9OJ_003984, partial [Myxococcota bacterium]